MSNHWGRATVGIVVERRDSKWIPFEYRMFHCRQRNPNTWDWANSLVGMLGVLGGLPGEEKMKVGEVRRYWVRMSMHAWSDYWGEWDEDVEILKIRRAK